MTPERKGLVAAMRDAANGWPLHPDTAKDVADALESAGTCGFCGREVHADLKPMCGDCAGREGPATVALRADLAKAHEEISALTMQLAVLRIQAGGGSPHDY